MSRCKNECHVADFKFAPTTLEFLAHALSTSSLKGISYKVNTLNCGLSQVKIHPVRFESYRMSWQQEDAKGFPEQKRRDPMTMC